MENEYIYWIDTETNELVIEEDFEDREEEYRFDLDVVAKFCYKYMDVQ